MPDTTITSANSVVTFTVPGLFPAPVQLQGYSADRAWQSQGVDLAEMQMSIDGRQTGGYTPNPVPQTFSLQADSPSKPLFNEIVRKMKTTREIIYINATIDLPGPQESYVCRRGVLQNAKLIPDAGKVLQAMDYTVLWESIDPTI